MLDMDRILSLFCRFSGLPQEQAEDWYVFCENARCKLESRIRAGVLPLGHQELERLCVAAAGLAYASWAAVRGAAIGGGDEIRVGDVSVKRAQAQTGALDLRDYCLEQVCDLLEPAVQALRQVDG